MFLTKKHLPRRTFLRGAGVTLALPFWTRWSARTLLAQTAASRRPALWDLFPWDGARLLIRRPGAGWKFPTRSTSRRDLPRVHDDSERAACGAPSGARQTRRTTGWRRRSWPQTSRDGPPGRACSTARRRSDHRAEDQAGQHNYLAAAGRRIGGVEQLRRRLQLAY